jgi:hypothetical protein
MKGFGVGPNDPARRTSSRSQTGEFISLTTGRRLVFTGMAQRDIALSLDVDYRTIDLETAITSFTIDYGEGERRYTPHVLATSITGERVFARAFGTADGGAPPTGLLRKLALESECQAHGATLHEFPYTQIANSALVANAIRIWVAASVPDAEGMQAVRAVLRRFHSPCELGDLQLSGLDDKLTEVLLGMVGKREVAIPLDQPIGTSTMVHW